MPGHEKKTGGGADPDPSPFLFVPYEEKQKDLAKVILNFFTRGTKSFMSPFSLTIPRGHVGFL